AGSKQAVLAAACGLAPGHPACPAEIDLDDSAAPWPVAQALTGGQALRVEAPAVPELPRIGWDDPPRHALVLPLTGSDSESAPAVLVMGLNPLRPLDEVSRSFAMLVAGHIATTLAAARACQTERRRTEALADLDQAKTAFLSSISHDFRTPLALILGPLEELLAASTLPAELRSPLTGISRAGLRLLKLVNALLDFSRIEAGHMTATLLPADLSALTAGLAETFRTVCDRADLLLRVECPPLPGLVQVDSEMWEKIVLNLLSNAFKYTLSGEIAVIVGMAGDHACLTVRDTGTGIPAADLPRLFERFHRIKGSRGRSHEGSGIGLALVRGLVRLQGGTIAVDSNPEGTAVTVRLPLSPHPPAAPPRETGDRPSGSHAQVFVEEALEWLENAAADGQPPVSQARPHILLADDNAVMRNYIRRLLGDGFAVEAATDGQEALVAALQQPPDLVLSDVMMPGMDGLDLVRALRRDPRIVRNLLANAIRYTDRGGVLLGIRRRGGHVRIEVWDTGLGIPAQELDRIWEEFY
ncbi:MAG: response regulator, partial [Rhodospirillales bacterium]|nr:response regulator [Rhodospirillales bacterium]